MNFYYSYVLQSLKSHKYYYGFTNNPKSRIEQHNKGRVESTKHRSPLKLVYFEGCLNKADALKREKYFKTYYGRMYLKKRLLNSYSTGQVKT